jgi:hypothetical protein
VIQALEGWDRIDAAALRSAPSTHAVVALVDAQGNCVLCAATGDARAFCEKRREQIEAGSSTVSVYALACGSMFEAELTQIRFTRTVMPKVYRQTIAAWQPWLLSLDLARGTWKACALSDAVASGDGDDGGVLVGPMPDKSAPVILGELLDDVFDLCRYPSELGKAPSGRACAYQEMGRCPAPCDGSELWPEFLARFAAAAGALTSVGQLIEVIEHRMREAGARCDFERGAHLKELAANLRGRKGQRFMHISHLNNFTRVAVVPTTKGSGSQVYLCRADGLTELGHLPRLPDPASCTEIAERVSELRALTKSFTPSPDARGDLAFISHRLFMARKPEVFLTLDEGSNPDILRRAASRTPNPEPKANHD